MAARTTEYPAPATLPNRNSPWANTAEKKRARQGAAEAHLQVLRSPRAPA